MNVSIATQVLDGLMLGDGNLQRYRNTAYYQMQQSKQTISLEDHIKWLCWLRDNVFKILDIKSTVKAYQKTVQDGRKHKTVLAASLWTERSLLLAKVYDEWYIGGEWTKRGYIKGGVKVLAKQLTESPVLSVYQLAHWFLCDGGSSWHYYKGTKSAVYVSLSTHSFTKDEVYYLIHILSNMGVQTTKPYECIHKKGSGLIVWLSQNSVNYFMSLIEPHILEIFSDSVGPSYIDMIKYRPTDPIPAEHTEHEFISLRRSLGII